jgi:hypothetical protein
VLTMSNPSGNSLRALLVLRFHGNQVQTTVQLGGHVEIVKSLARPFESFSTSWPLM